MQIVKTSGNGENNAASRGEEYVDPVLIFDDDEHAEVLKQALNIDLIIKGERHHDALLPEVAPTMHCSPYLPQDCVELASKLPRLTAGARRQRRHGRRDKTEQRQQVSDRAHRERCN